MESAFEVSRVNWLKMKKQLLLVTEALNESYKIKGSDRISFIVDGQKIVRCKVM